MTTEVLTDEAPPPPPPPRRGRASMGLVLAAAVVLGVLAALSLRAASRQNHQPLTATPRGVTAVLAQAASYREERRYVGVVEPWVEAHVGPEFISSWVTTVLVRPGDRVKRGDVLATLDCRNASTNTEHAAQQARSLEERQRAMANETARLENLLGGGFISANEIEQKKSQAAANLAQLDALRAQLRNRTLEAGDCTLRAPFDGEISERSADPGAFVRPGTPLVTVVDRHLYRVVVDVPEVDYPLVEVNTPVRLHLLATGQDVTATVSRRAPSAGASSRTLRLEIDLSSRDVQVPVGTTAEVRLDVGEAREATEVPLAAAKVRGARATVWTVEGAAAKKHTTQVLGERGGRLYLTGLAPKTPVITEGKQALSDGDAVVAHVDASWPPRPPAATPRAETTAGRTPAPSPGGRP